jgi:hypothetical protein
VRHHYLPLRVALNVVVEETRDVNEVGHKQELHRSFSAVSNYYKARDNVSFPD